MAVILSDYFLIAPLSSIDLSVKIWDDNELLFKIDDFFAI